MLLTNSMLAQKSGMKLPVLEGKQYLSNKGSEIQKTEFEGSVIPAENSEDWGISIQNITSFYHPTPIPKAEFELLKNKANERRGTKIEDNEAIKEKRNETLSEDSLDLQLNFNFRGNLRDNSVPMDNTVAVSRNGFIVSAINVNVIFSNPAGDITLRRSLADFFRLLNLGAVMYDPRVIYDTEENRFIFMCLHGSDPNSTFLCLAFSKTEDPNGEWNFYKIKGNPSGDNHWFDYPNIAVSAHDYYIAGLMRDNDGDWQYSVLYQIDKKDGFEGKELRWKYYNELKNADGAPSFNLVPTPSGWSDLLDPGMFFVSNEALGGDLYNLYFTTESLHNNPELISLQTRSTATELAPYGRQLGTSKLLNTFDSRIWSALYLDGVIHMGSHVNTSSGDVGLFYGRLDIENVQVYADVLTIPDYDFGFPSFSSFGASDADAEILVNYLISGKDIFPSQEQRVCRGRNGNFEWGAPVMLKEGTDYISFLTGNLERWGDYTTSSRRFGVNRVESWVAGCYGESRRYSNWLGQYIKKSEFLALPMAEFVADKTTTQKNIAIQFRDITQNNPSEWQWFFEGGTPSESSIANPVVTFAENGAYNVTLIVKNELGYDTMVKPHYIHIVDQILPPVANFRAERDTIFRGDSVKYINLSSPNSTVFLWDFFSGMPSRSEEREPTVRYMNAGSFLVSLTARNSAGSNVRNTLRAITVINRSQPGAKFTVDRQFISPGESVMFIDQSTGGPRSYEWSFPGGSPSTSDEKNPVVNYNEQGTYSVSLRVQNEFGEDFEEKFDFINVGTVSVEDLSSEVNTIKLFPNPLKNERLNISFVKKSTGLMRIELFDQFGRSVKLLHNYKVKAGENILGFNTEGLSGGIYFINLSMEGYSKSFPFVVVE